MYDHSKQYRCDMIRGKSQTQMDDLLVAYALVLDAVCPCRTADFREKFNSEFAKLISGSHSIKTLDNHRTEISGKLFGMYFQSGDGYIYASERTLKYLKDSDQPAFFKDICYKLQFPNGMQKIRTVRDRTANRISIRPCSYVLGMLKCAAQAGMQLTKNDIAYYVLNSLDVLQGHALPSEVIKQIATDRQQGVDRLIRTDGKERSYNYQHIDEQLNMLELANLIIVGSGRNPVICQNIREECAVELLAKGWDKPPAFDVYRYDLDSSNGRRGFFSAWALYYSKISTVADNFTTTVEALGATTLESELKEDRESATNLMELGNEGEQYIYSCEKKRVSAFNPRLARKVISMGKTRGLGYDIQSVIAEAGEQEEFVKYIEVKSTKRVTKPNLNDTGWTDTINMTRNEWVAACQHKEYYSLYRVYFTRDEIVVHVVKNPYKKREDQKLTVTPTQYRVDFGKDAVDKII